MSQPKVLTEDEIQVFVEEFGEWKHVKNHLQASFDFADFQTAFAFMTEIAKEAEDRDHHPEWSNTYSHVEFSLATHSVGDKVTNLDLEMATFISKTATKFIKTD